MMILLGALILAATDGGLATTTSQSDSGVQRLQMLLLPGGAEESASLISEETAALEGVSFAVCRGLVENGEAPKLREALKDAYAELRRAYGETPTPVFRTLGGNQSPAGFHLIVIPPAHGPADPRRAAIYLHGYGGSFTLQCHLFARAAGRAGLLTVCPAMDQSGHWAERSGRKILDETIAWLAERGHVELVLAGLSNGGAGAATLARADEAKFRALVSIAGVQGRGPEQLPVLVLHGEKDASARYSNAKAFAAARPRRTLVTFVDGSHYAFLYERERAAAEISNWLRTTLGAVR